MTPIFLLAVRAGALTPEAQEVLDILERRILHAEAGQASLDLFLEDLESGDGCRDWAEDRRWKRDPDLKAAMEAACPDPAGERRRGRPAWSGAGPSPADPDTGGAREREAGRRPVRGRLGLAQGMRPLAEGRSPPPELSAGLSAPMAGPGKGSPWIGGETMLSGSDLLRRRAWFAGPGLAVQAGGLAFGPDASPGLGHAAGPRGQGIPRLAFVTGRRGFPGTGWLSGVEGAWEARSPALDGLAVTVRREGWRAGGFATWNRQETASSSLAGRRDASVLSASADMGTGPWNGSVQAARLRLETAGWMRPSAGSGDMSVTEGGPPIGGVAAGVAQAGGALAGEDPISDASGGPSGRMETREIWVAGAEVERRIAGGADAGPGSLRVGLAASRLGDDGRARGLPGASGGYAELEWRDGEPDRFSLELRQATARWANPLSAAPALGRDTLEGGWILPGRGEGGFNLRSRMALFRAGPWQATAVSAGDAAWSLPAGFLAGSGRLVLCLGAGAWEGRISRGVAWRKDGLPASGSPILGAQSLIWKDGPWKVETALSSRAARNRKAWPFRLEAGWDARSGNRWKLEGASEDLLSPLAAYRLSCLQAWRLGKGVSVLQDMSLPVEGYALRSGMRYRLGLEMQGF